MGRRRQQQPNVFKTAGKRPMWFFRARVDTIQSVDGQRATGRPDKRYYLGFCDEVGKQEAKSRRNEILAEAINRPQVLIPSQVKFSEVLKLYRREALPAVRVTTRTTYESALKYVDKLGDLRMCDINALALQRWTNEMNLSYSTKRQYLAIVRIIWGCAVEWEYTQQVWPGRKVKLGVKRTVKGREMPTTDQLRRLLAALEDPYRAMAEVALCTGLRISELRGLQWSDCGPNALIVTRRLSKDNDVDILKNGKTKVLDMRPLRSIFERIKYAGVGVDGDTLMRDRTVGAGESQPEYLGNKAVDCYAASYNPPSPARTGTPAPDYIFAAAGCYGSCQLAMKAARATAGITTARFSWHHLRAVFNTLVRQAGADSTDRLAMMGHSSERQNQAYIYAEGEDLRRRGDQMLQVQSLVMGESKGRAN